MVALGLGEGWIDCIWLSRLVACWGEGGSVAGLLFDVALVRIGNRDGCLVGWEVHWGGN